jgi:hypothetical protein
LLEIPSDQPTDRRRRTITWNRGLNGFGGDGITVVQVPLGSLVEVTSDGLMKFGSKRIQSRRGIAGGGRKEISDGDRHDGGVPAEIDGDDDPLPHAHEFGAGMAKVTAPHMVQTIKYRIGLGRTHGGIAKSQEQRPADLGSRHGVQPMSDLVDTRGINADRQRGTLSGIIASRRPCRAAPRQQQRVAGVVDGHMVITALRLPA